MPSGPRPAVLLVDDRHENLAALDAVLAPLGNDCYHAGSGREALRWILRRDFALVLMDAEMPGMDGFETARVIRLRERTRHLPIIFLTAAEIGTEKLMRAYEVGGVDILGKPFDPEILRAKTRVFVELWHRGEQIKRQQEQLRKIGVEQAERRERESALRAAQEQTMALNSVLESRVAERTSQLVQANEEMEAFCYSVSHDLRAPLRAVLATSRLLIEEAGERLNEEDNVLLERQIAAAKRMAALIDDLLELFRMGLRPLVPGEVDLTALARAVAEETLAVGWPKPLEIEVEDGLRCHGDIGVLRSLLQNLLENACKYSPEGGTVKVGCRDGVFFIRDEGIGFHMDFHHKLFQPFERLVSDNAFPGTGVGLANAKRIVARHGGRIWAQSQPGQGSTFFFTLWDTGYPS